MLSWRSVFIVMAIVAAMLAKDPDLASRMKGKLDRMIELVGLRSETAKERLAEVEVLFEGSDILPTGKPVGTVERLTQSSKMRPVKTSPSVITFTPIARCCWPSSTTIVLCCALKCSME